MKPFIFLEYAQYVYRKVKIKLPKTINMLFGLPHIQIHIFNKHCQYIKSKTMVEIQIYIYIFFIYINCEYAISCNCWTKPALIWIKQEPSWFFKYKHKTSNYWKKINVFKLLFNMFVWPKSKYRWLLHNIHIYIHILYTSYWTRNFYSFSSTHIFSIIIVRKLNRQIQERYMFLLTYFCVL